MFTDYLETSNPNIIANYKQEAIQILNKRNDNNISTMVSNNDDDCTGFDPNTLIHLNNDRVKNIKDINVGDILINGVEVLGIIKQNIKLDSTFIYKCNNVITTSNQLILYKKNWIMVGNHPDSVEVNDYSNTILYNLVTGNTNIIIGNDIFRDYLEVIDKDYNDRIDESIVNDLNSNSH